MAAKIVLAVRESQFIEPVLHFVHHSDYGEMLRITAFSRMETFMAFMKSGEAPDAVIGDPVFIEAWLLESRSRIPWAVLHETSGSINPGPGGQTGTAIAKYQALPALLEAILQLCDVRKVKPAAAVREELLLLGLVSASGGSGRTTIALNMAKVLGGMGLSVFYLNLESVDSSVLPLRSASSGGPGLDGLLYELNARQNADDRNSPGTKPDIGKYVIRHERLRCDAFRPPANLQEMLQMTRQDTLELLELIAGSGKYDVILADTGGLEEERTLAVLERCRSLLWILRNDDASLYKTERWLKQYASGFSDSPAGILERSAYIMNRAEEGADHGVLSEGLRIDAALPDIPSWSLRHQGELRLNSPQFIAGIRKLCQTVVEPALPRVFTGKST